MRPFIRNAVFFIGWLLSPLTFWNDAVVNIPLSYLLANITIKLLPRDFVSTVIVFYWVSNIAGLFLMYISGRQVVKGGEGVIRELISLFLTILSYTAILLVLGKFGILKPCL